MSKDRRWELFECQRCGICCTGIELPYDPKSIFEIAKFLKLTIKEVIEAYYGRLSEDGKSLEFEEHKRMPCPFLTNEPNMKKSCRIYPVRPYACRDYPFDTMGSLDCPVARKVYAKLREEEA